MNVHIGGSGEVCRCMQLISLENSYQYYKSCDQYYESCDQYYKSCDQYYKSCDQYYKSCDQYYKSCDQYYKSCDQYYKPCDRYCYKAYKNLYPVMQVMHGKSEHVTHLLSLALLHMLCTRNNTDGSKLVLYSFEL